MAQAIWPQTWRQAERSEQKKAASLPLENRFYAVDFDLATGRFSAWRADGTALWTEAVATATLSTGIRMTADWDYAREIKIIDFADAQGRGKKLIALCFDARRQLDFEVRLSLYDEREALTVETIARNVSRKPLVVKEVQSLQTLSGQIKPEAKTVLPGEENKSRWNIGVVLGNQLAL